MKPKKEEAWMCPHCGEMFEVQAKLKFTRIWSHEALAQLHEVRARLAFEKSAKRKKR